MVERLRLGCNVIFSSAMLLSGRVNHLFGFVMDYFWCPPLCQRFPQFPLWHFLELFLRLAADDPQHATW